MGMPPMMPSDDDGDESSPMAQLRSLPGSRQSPVGKIPAGEGPTMGARGTVPQGPPHGKKKKGVAALPHGITHPPHMPPGGHAALSAKRGGPAPPGAGGLLGSAAPQMPPGALPGGPGPRPPLG